MALKRTRPIGLHVCLNQLPDPYKIALDIIDSCCEPQSKESVTAEESFSWPGPAIQLAAMLKILLIAAIVILIIIAGVLGLAARKPPRFSIQRSVTIRAGPEKVFALINDLRRWPEWSDSEKDGSTLARKYSGAPAGRGAIYEWDGKGNAGAGRLEIVESSPTLIRLQADWARPFAARNINCFNIDPQGNGTRVTWTLDGENVFMLKVMTVFVSTESLMGPHLEKGLAGLKASAEK
ncbi:MAG TPA: SRPBCC family protein [Candidatus Angelobacter sp.]|nr:SRPBCC family protein [Candidatus Angelobacter sp.]